MDKKIFLFDKEVFSEATIQNLTEKDCEKWAAENDYVDNDIILKVDANVYDSVADALEGEVAFLDRNDYYIKEFGFSGDQKEAETKRHIISITMNIVVDTLEKMSVLNIVSHLDIKVEGDDVVTPKETEIADFRAIYNESAL